MEYYRPNYYFGVPVLSSLLLLLVFVPLLSRGVLLATNLLLPLEY